MNGNFFRWMGGIVAGLVLLAVSGGVLFDRETASQVAQQGAAIQAIQTAIATYRDDIRKSGPFNREDADRELHARDLAIERLERRVDQLERNRKP